MIVVALISIIGLCVAFLGVLMKIDDINIRVRELEARPNTAGDK